MAETDDPYYNRVIPAHLFADINADLDAEVARLLGWENIKRLASDQKRLIGNRPDAVADKGKYQLVPAYSVCRDLLWQVVDFMVKAGYNYELASSGFEDRPYAARFKHKDKSYGVQVLDRKPHLAVYRAAIMGYGK